MIDTGGFIFLVKSGDEIVGTAALIKETPIKFELVKMAVSPSYQGKGISRLLIEKCLQAAQEAGAEECTFSLIVNSPRLLLCMKNMGLSIYPVTDAHYPPADVMMEVFL